MFLLALSSIWTVCNHVLSMWLNAYLKWKTPIRSLDGKRELPTVPYEWPNGQGDVGKFLEGLENSAQWEKEHGSVYRIWSGTQSEIVLTDPKHVRTGFIDSHKHAKAINNDSGWLMGELLGKCVGLVSGSRWRNLREETAQYFSHKSAASYIPRIRELVRDYFHELEAKGHRVGNRINPVRDLRLLPFWIVADVLFGDLRPDQKSELVAMIPLRERIWSQMIQGGLVRYSWSQYLPTQVNKDLYEFKRRWARFNHDVYISRIVAHEEAPIVRMHEAVRQGKIGQEEMLQTLDEMLFANLDVTIGSISWNLLFLAEHPQIQQDIRREYHGKVRDSDDSRSSYGEYTQSSSTLLAACILESARLRPLAAFSVPQAPPSPRRFGAYSVPPGINLVVDACKLNVQAEFWGPDRASYRPSRFFEHTASELRYRYWRFGFGPRQCLGKYVVDVLMRVLVLHLLDSYELGLLPETSWQRDPSMWIMHPNTDLACHPRSVT